MTMRNGLTSHDGLRYVAIAELLLIFPAGLFMAALFVRNLQPAPYEPAQSARNLVEWFSARPLLGLDIFLIALPFTAFFLGGTTALRHWSKEVNFRRAVLEALTIVRTHLAALLIIGATLSAGGILAIVALHMITE
jgi:hypothetical protein